MYMAIKKFINLRVQDKKDERDETFRKNMLLNLDKFSKKSNGQQKAEEFWSTNIVEEKPKEMEKHIASTKVVPQTVEDDNVNNIPPLNNKTENSKGNNNKHHSKKKCQIAIKYFQDKNLSPAEVTKALEDEKFTAIEIQTVMNGISFKKA